MVLSIEQTPDVSAQHLYDPFTPITRRSPRSAESVFAVVPTQLLVEAADPFLLLSDTVGSMQTGTCKSHTYHQYLIPQH